MASSQSAAVSAHDDSITAWDAITLSQKIHSRSVSCGEVMDAYLSRIELINPTINAIVAMPDHDSLRAQALERDNQLARGESLGWMHGIPQAIKDTALAAGIVSTSGSPILRNFVPDEDSLIAARVKDSGAIIIGKTNVPEFALGSHTYNPVYGTTVNPYDTSKTVGGSSGGAAAALAARMLPVADGSDMGGSIRNPSAFCNVYGLRPTAGVVPMVPSPEQFVQQFATEGPMGRTVADVARLLSVQAGYDPRAPLSALSDSAQYAELSTAAISGKKIGWIGDWGGYFATDPGVLELCRASLDRFASMGCEVEEVVPEFDPELLWQTWLTHRAWIIGNYLAPHYADPRTRELLKPEAQWEVEQSFGLTSQEVFASSIARTSWSLTVTKLFGDFDFLVAPTAQVFPFDATMTWPREVGGRSMETYHQWMGIVLPWTLAGTPVLNVPVGFSEGGLPMGVQLIGARHADKAVLELGVAYESVADWVNLSLPVL